ncbi:MAG: gamma-glutamyltransferase [Pseudomonadota bacterium]
MATSSEVRDLYQTFANQRFQTIVGLADTNPDKKIQLDHATPSSNIAPGSATDDESGETTHFSVIDADGNVVANTYTLNFSFGTGITVAGFLLNNEMADFAAKPGSPDAFGLVGSDANAIEPGKRPLSSMTPTLVFKDGAPFLITGSPGGSRIITAVLQQVVNVLDHEANLATATHHPRIHHQWYPDTLYYEAGTNPDTLNLLKQWGHNIEPSGTMGSLQSILWLDGKILGADDPRRPGAGVATLSSSP